MKRAVALSVFVLAGCSNSGATQCQPSIMCGMDSVQVCCTTHQCQYQVGGMTFACAGTDCTAASMQVLALCPDSGVHLDGGVVLDSGVDATVDAGIDVGP